MLGTKTV